MITQYNLYLAETAIFYLKEGKLPVIQIKGNPFYQPTKRTLAKLFLNNLYGKFASTPDSSFKVCYLRNFTIRAAQANYYSPDKAGFIYVDTDSIYCDLKPEQVKGITVHPTDFCCWKLESYWDEAVFARQKTYIEHVVAEDMEPIEKPYYNITCAGMPQKCKDLLNESMTQLDKTKEHNEKEKEFLSVHRTLKDFKVGLIVPGKLMPKRIPGGTILVETTFEMR